MAEAPNNEAMDAIQNHNPQELTTSTALNSPTLVDCTVGTSSATEEAAAADTGEQEQQEEEEEEESSDGDDGNNESSVHQNKRKLVEDWDEMLAQELNRAPKRGMRFKAAVERLEKEALREYEILQELKEMGHESEPEADTDVEAEGEDDASQEFEEEDPAFAFEDQDAENLEAEEGDIDILESLEASTTDDDDYLPTSSDNLTSDCQSQSISQDASAMDFANIATTVFGDNDQNTRAAEASEGPGRHPWYWTRSRVLSWSITTATATGAATTATRATTATASCE